MFYHKNGSREEGEEYNNTIDKLKGRRNAKGSAGIKEGVLEL